MFNARLLLAVVGLSAAFATDAAPGLSAATPTAEYCLAGQAPDFSLGFAALRERVGLDMSARIRHERLDELAWAPRQHSEP